LQDALAVIALDAARELADRGQLARPEQRPVAAPVARPRQRAIVPDRPDVHGDDEPVGIDWLASSAVPANAFAGTLDGDQSRSPKFIVHARLLSCLATSGVSMDYFMS